MPTPPFPLATASTRVPESTEIPGVRSLTPPRSREVNAAFSSGRHHVEAELDLVDAVEGHERLLDLLLEARAKRASGHGEGDHHRDAPAVDHHVAHHVELDHRAAELGVVDALERAPEPVRA